MAETTIAPGNKLQAYQRRAKRARPRMSAFLGESQAASDGGRWTKRQEGGPYKPGAVSLGTSHGTRSISPPTEVRAETGGIPGAVGRMGLPIEETAPEVIERYTGKPAYQYLQAGRKKGGKVRPGRHHLLVVMIGLKPKVDRLRKQGMISDKAHAKRRLP